MIQKILSLVSMCFFCVASVAWANRPIPLDQTSLSTPKTTSTPAGAAVGKTTPPGTTVAKTSTPGQASVTSGLGTATAGGGKSSTTGANATAAESFMPMSTSVGIVLKSMDASKVYAADGRVFPLTSSTIVTHERAGSRMPTAQLFFRNGVLVQVIINN